jgi:hypothetical protein
MEKRRRLLEEVDGGGWLVGQPDSAPLYRLFHSALALEMPSAAVEYCCNYLVACIYIYVVFVSLLLTGAPSDGAAIFWATLAL